MFFFYGIVPWFCYELVGFPLHGVSGQIVFFFFCCCFSLSSCTDWNCQREHGRKKSAWNGMLPQRDKASAMWGNKSDQWDSCQGAWTLSTHTGYFPGTGSLIRPWMHIAAAYVVNTLVMPGLCNLTLFDLLHNTTVNQTLIEFSWRLACFAPFRPRSKNCGTNNCLHPINSTKEPKLQSHLFYFCSVAKLQKDGEKWRFDRKETTRQQCSTFFWYGQEAINQLLFAKR